MSSNRSTRRNISGPHSALTDFLAAHNISAADIRDSYQQRLQRNQTQNQDQNQDQAQQDTQASASAAAAAAEATAQTQEQEQAAQEADAVIERSRAGRKRKQTAAQLAKEKAAAKKKARKATRDDYDDDEDFLDDADFMLKSRQLPGQLANCEICSKRFTVTPYSKEGPDGGLLCTPCGKELAADEKSGKKADGKKTGKKAKRQNFSNLLDGIAQRGAFSLLEMCIKRVADNINDIEEFGDLPPKLLHRLSEILSRRRALTPRTVGLFMRQDIDFIEIFDCAKLEEEDFQKIFAFMPFVEKVDFRCAGQMKDGALEYLTDRECRIKHLQLDSCNLISDECWQKFFEVHGSKLEVLKLSNLDVSMGDDTVAHMVKHCPNLRFLKLTNCWKPTDASLKSVASLSKLEGLSLNLIQPTSHEALLDLISSTGPNLRTLSLRNIKAADDAILDMIHLRCANLTKLRLSDNSLFTDKGFASLFTDWRNPGLLTVDVSGNRDVDNANPDGPEDTIGFASDGFKALMKHSGSTLRRLNISSCRHISFAAFSEVFAEDNKSYPRLHELDMSFQTCIDDFLVGSIFRSCPGLAKVIAFACFQVRDVTVPRGVAMIGGMNAQRSIAT